MKEKITNFFKSEKLKNTTKKIFTKKTVVTAVIIVVVVAGLKIGYSLMYDIKGVVSKVEGTKITLVTRLNTQTVDVANSAVDATKIIVGERIEIVKNISGEVLYVKDESSRGNNRLQGKEGNRMQDMRGRKGNKEFKQGTQKGSTTPKSTTTQNNGTTQGE